MNYTQSRKRHCVDNPRARIKQTPWVVRLFKPSALELKKTGLRKATGTIHNPVPLTPFFKDIRIIPSQSAHNVYYVKLTVLFATSVNYRQQYDTSKPRA